MNKIVSLLFALFVFSPLLNGAVRNWVWFVNSGLCFLMMAAWCLHYMKGKTHISACLHTVPARFAAGLFFCATVWGLLQALPLPFAWLAKLPVPTAVLYSQAAVVISPQTSLQNIPLSVDSSITSEIALRGAAYFCLYLLLLLVIDTRSRLRMLCYIIVLSGLFQAALWQLYDFVWHRIFAGRKKTNISG